TQALLQIDDCLLVELALALQKWLFQVECGVLKDFYYTSQDFEEEPILLFQIHQQTQSVRVSSILEPTITISDKLIYFTEQCYIYIDQLFAELNSKHHIYL
ncbi:MAG: hypothetical protein OXT67_05525, partial [Zetaproteobacteria bacterium]|nr:hypothetical protein [Zetaproteobacteria bacterium]